MLNKSLLNFWNNFKAQPDVWFFYAFLATFTFSIRKIILFHPINGKFNEYSGIFLYLSDIFLIMTFIAWITLKLYHKRLNLSIKNYTFVPRGTLTLILASLSWSLISILWSENQDIAFFRFTKLLELSLLSLFIIKKIVPRETIFKNSLLIIIISAVFQSIIGILQFATQKSIGLFWLKESQIGPDILGVAKIIFDNEKFIRPYGLFPHPNIFGGFLLFSIISTYLYYKLFHVEHLNDSNKANCSTWNNNKIKACDSKLIVPRGTINKKNVFLYKLTIFILTIALILTFSKSAILGLFIAIMYISKIYIVPRGTKTIIHVMQNIVSRGTIAIKKIFLIFFIIITFFAITKPDLYSLLFKSLNERIIFLNVSHGTIIENPFFGLGIGQFVLEMKNYTNLKLLEWQYQPVHNVFLLIWGELGIIGLLLFLIFLWKLFHVEQLNISDKVRCSTWNKNSMYYSPERIIPRGTNSDIQIISLVSRGLLLGIIFIMLFDHYLWDIQQGQLVLFITLALVSYKKPI